MYSPPKQLDKKDRDRLVESSTNFKTYRNPQRNQLKRPLKSFEFTGVLSFIRIPNGQKLQPIDRILYRYC